MRVLHLSWEYPPHLIGGLGRHVADLTPALAECGVEVTIVTPQLLGGPTEEQVATVAIHRMESAQRLDQDQISYVQQHAPRFEQAARQLVAQQGGFDLIHAHDWLVAHAAVRLKHLWRIPLIATIHATERGRGNGHLLGADSEAINQIEWHLCYEAWRTIACSQFMADELVSHFQTPADKIDVIANGVNMRQNPFTSPQEQRAFRRRFAADDEGLLFYVGRIVYEKGVQYAIQAMRTLPTPSRLIVAGTGPHLAALKALAVNEGVAGQVIFTGFISDEDRDRLYRIADAAIFPSLYEPFGIVALEAAAAACPLVASRVGGLAEVITSHETGILVEPGAVDSLVWGIQHTLAHPEWAAVRAKNLLNEIQYRYTWLQIAKQTVAVYRRVLAEYQQGTWGHELQRVTR